MADGNSSAIKLILAGGAIFGIVTSTPANDCQAKDLPPAIPIDQGQKTYHDKSTTTVTTSHPITKEELAMLVDNYRVTDLHDVLNFLTENKNLIPLLDEIPGEVEKYFGPSVLNMSFHHSYALDRDSIRINISSEGDSNSLMDALSNFDAGWWIRNEMDLIKNISIDIG